MEAPRGQALVQEYGGRCYRNLEELAADPTVDFVSVVTPENAHLEPFEILASAGKAIYVEKPLATSLAEASRMRECAATITAMSGHCLRFEQRVSAALARLHGVPKYHLTFRNRRTRIEKATYGRVHPAYAMLCHEVDLSNAFAEGPFRRVMALETRYSPGQVDGMTILIEYDNGVTSCVEGGWHLPAQEACTENDHVSIVSAEGVEEMTLPHQGHMRWTSGGLTIPNSYYGYTVHGTEYGPLRAAMDYFVDCIRKNQKPTIATIDDAHAAVEIIEAALRSARDNRWITRADLHG